MKRILISLILALALLGLIAGSAFAGLPGPIPKPGAVKADLYSDLPGPLPMPVGFVILQPDANPNMNLHILVSLHGVTSDTDFAVVLYDKTYPPGEEGYPNWTLGTLTTDKKGNGNFQVSMYFIPGQTYLFDIRIGDHIGPLATLPGPLPYPPGRVLPE
jgi:hypothetical protein